MTSIKLYSKEQADSLLAQKANTSDLPSASELVPATSQASVGDVLTFDGSDVGWAPVSGGSGWEEVDLNNFPNDWTEGDIILISFKLATSISGSVTSWTASSTATPNTSPSDSYRGVAVMLKFVNVSTVYPAHPINISVANPNCIIINTIQDINYTSWNTHQSGTRLLRISSVIFNAAFKSTDKATDITLSNITQYVSSMYRYRTS